MFWYYSPLGMILEEKNTSTHAGYVRLPGGQLLSISGPDGVFHYFVDASDNAIGIIDSSGTADWHVSAVRRGRGRAGVSEIQSLPILRHPIWIT